MSRFDSQIRELKAKFQATDTSGDGRLSYEELAKLLRKGKPDMRDRDIRILFNGIDKNHDNKIDFAEFVDFVYNAGREYVKLHSVEQRKRCHSDASDLSSTSPGALPGLEAPEGWRYAGMDRDATFASTIEEEEIDWETVHMVYKHYSGNNREIESHEWMKMCRESGLIGGDFSYGDVDVVFTIAVHGHRHMRKKHFREAIKLVARKKHVPTTYIRSVLAMTESAYSDNPANYRRSSRQSSKPGSDASRRGSAQESRRTSAQSRTSRSSSKGAPSDEEESHVMRQHTDHLHVPNGKWNNSVRLD
mmetsp:Transcript_2309/g.4822  ORF Transcript_2309/g.4822 Transcript_2309/m.4822 type:complete len:304 (+) Transcript_2309:104-1015(+)